MVLLGILPRVGCRDAASRVVGRPLRAQARLRDLLGAVRCWLGGMRVLNDGPRVHGCPGTARARRGGCDRHVDLLADGSVQQGGATESSRDPGCRELPRDADRSDPWGMAADQLLVGVGLPDQRAGRPDRPGCCGRSATGVSRAPAARFRFGRSGRFDPRAGHGDLRTDQGWRGRLDQPWRDPWSRRRYRGPDRLPCLGAPADTPS